MVAASRPAFVLCPLSGQLMTDPVLASDGHVYDRASLELIFGCSLPPTKKAKKKKDGCPLPRSPATGTPFPSRAVAVSHVHAAVRKVWEEGGMVAGDADVAASVTDPPYPAPTIGSDTLDRLVKIYADLSGIGIADVAKPCIAVLGHESVGKSTLLERLIGLALLPRGTARMTTMPIRVVLERTPEWSTPRVRVVDCSGDAPEPAWTELPRELPLDRVNDVLRHIMTSVRGERSFVADQELQVRIAGPGFPCMHILDLPGLPGHDSDGFADAAALLQSVVARVKPTAHFLCLQSMRENQANSSVVAFVRQCGVQAHTTGVLTKCDAAPPEDPDVRMATAVADRVALAPQDFGGGFFVTASRAASTLSGRGRMVEMNRKEAQLKADDLLVDGVTEAERRLVSERWGADVLRQHLQHVYERFIESRWIGVVERLVDDTIADFARERLLAGVPLAPPSSAAELAHADTIREYVKHHSNAPRFLQALVSNWQPEVLCACIRRRLESALAAFRPQHDVAALERAAAELHAALEELGETAECVPGSDVDAAAVLRRREEAARAALQRFVGSGVEALARDVGPAFTTFAAGLDPDAEEARASLLPAIESGELSHAQFFVLARFPAVADEFARLIEPHARAAAASFEELAHGAAVATKHVSLFRVVRGDGECCVQPRDAEQLCGLLDELYYGRLVPCLADAVGAAIADLEHSLRVATVRLTTEPLEAEVLREAPDLEAARTTAIEEISKRCQVLCSLRQNKPPQQYHGQKS